MKNIRFRIWNGVNLVFGGSATQTIKLCVMRAADGCPGTDPALSAMTGNELMLATGMQDLDAHEVYEGDICQGKITIACVAKIIDRGEVTYNPKNARFEIKCGDASLPLNMVSGLKVIGNIHENQDGALEAHTQCLCR
ncbi:MAG: hypothetical protein HQL86_01380 [Magnetococcales bacterium]|nr:hypothetical protein [Magnetococcales bacterium]